MDLDIFDKLVSIFFIVMGIYLIVNHRKFGRERVTADSRRRWIFPIKGGTAKGYSILYLVGGIIFTVVAGLALLGVIHYRH